MTQFINIHTHYYSKNNSDLSLYNYRYQEDTTEVLGTVGLHPFDIKENYIEQLNNIKSLFTYKNILAIGECGLDKNSAVSIDKQIEVFEFQIQESIKLNKPLIIHLVGYYDVFFKIRKQYYNTPLWLIHGFQKNNELAKQLTNSGCVLSFGKSLLHKKTLSSILQQQQKFYLETDNESTLNIQDVYESCANQIGIDIEALKTKIYNNFKTDFLL